jgi:hypothetical protein
VELLALKLENCPSVTGKHTVSTRGNRDRISQRLPNQPFILSDKFDHELSADVSFDKQALFCGF